MKAAIALNKEPKEIKLLNIIISFTDMSRTTIPYQSGSGSNDNEEVIPHKYSTWAPELEHHH